MGGMSGSSLALDRQEVGADQSDAVIDAPARALGRHRRVAIRETYRGLRPQLGVRGPEQYPFGAFGDRERLQLVRGDRVAGAAEVRDERRPDEHAEVQRLRRGAAGDEMERRIDVRPCVRPELELRHIRRVALGDPFGGVDLNRRIARPGQHLRADNQRNVVDHCCSFTTACPPNSFRSAAIIFIANESSWREAKRANSASAVTGAGTFSSIASSTVQRPSPESATYPLICSSAGSAASARSARSNSHERTTDPYRQTSAIWCRSRCGKTCEPFMISKPSAYACSNPYSIPLWTIFTKCPAPAGPTCAYPFSGANVARRGSIRRNSLSMPPTMRQ